jgi:HPt (histidine-containing phosphotransfer) domain-containing protein
MLQNLVDTTADNIVLLQQHIEIADRQNCQQLLHKLRGSYATIGADDLVKQALHLENNLATEQLIAEKSWQDFFTVYRQSCVELQAIINEHSVPASLSSSELDIGHLHTLLNNQDMAACTLIAKSKLQINQLMQQADADKFFHQVALLDFAKAALLLQKYLPSNATGR